jgi:hypothetical protein
MGKTASLLFLIYLLGVEGGCPSRSLPDMSTVLNTHAWGADPVGTNTLINGGYIKIAQAFHDILNPRNDMDMIESWFHVAPHASREVGRGIIAFRDTKDAIAAASTFPAVDWAALLCSTCSPTAKEAINMIMKALTTQYAVADYVGTLIEKLFTATVSAVNVFNIAVLYDSTYCTRTRTGTVISWFASKVACTGLRGHTIKYLFDKVVAVVGSKADVEKLLHTGMRLLEHGNRLIFSHIGSGAVEYLQWRPCDSVEVTPERVLGEFRLADTRAVVGHRWDASYEIPQSRGRTDSRNAQKLYDDAMRMLSAANSEKRKFLADYPCNDILVAGFAMWEGGANAFKRAKASGASVSDAQQMIKWGNNMLAFCEQGEAVVPAFRPNPNCRHSSSAECYQSPSGGVSALPGEIPRDKFMAILTPMVQLTLHGGAWSLDAYMHAIGKDKYFNKLNWGDFRDRYGPILNAFEKGYARPSMLTLPRNVEARLEESGGSFDMEEMDAALRELLAELEKM